MVRSFVVEVMVRMMIVTAVRPWPMLLVKFLVQISILVNLFSLNKRGSLFDQMWVGLGKI